LFEKYDGIRGFWNPSKKTFYSRLNDQLVFPQDIVNQMPTDLFVDGELWYPPNLLRVLIPSFLFSLDGNKTRFGHDSFQEAMKVASARYITKVDWSKFKYMAFDIPNHPGTYEERYNALGFLSCPPSLRAHSIFSIS